MLGVKSCVLEKSRGPFFCNPADKFLEARSVPVSPHLCPSAPIAKPWSPALCQTLSDSNAGH